MNKVKKWLGPAFVSFEAVMHLYLAYYLTVNWTNLAIWGFTIFELTMFIYLLKNDLRTKTEISCKNYMRGSCPRNKERDDIS